MTLIQKARRALLSALVLAPVLALEEASARIVELSLGPVSPTPVSGFTGQRVERLLRPENAILYRLDFGERGNTPCYVRAWWWLMDDDRARARLTRTLNLCGGNARSIKTVEVDRQTLGYPGIASLAVCNNRRSNRRLKGVNIVNGGQFLARLDDSVVTSGSPERFRRTNCARWSQAVACSRGEIAVGLDVHRNNDTITGLALRCAQPRAEVFSVNRGDFTYYPLDFRPEHWALLEDVHPLQRAAFGRPLDVLICQEDFPRGSQAERNVHLALDRVASIQNTKIAFEPRTEPCLDNENQTYVRADIPADIQIQIVDNACPRRLNTLIQPLNATAGVCYLNRGETEPWRIGDCNGWSDCWADSSLLMLRRSNYPDANNIPSVGVITHELGHLFGQVHNYDDDADACSGASSHRFRKPKLFHTLPGFAKGGGFARSFIHPFPGTANADMRQQNPTAYTTAYFQYRYGRHPMQRTRPTTPEWAIHSTLVQRSNTCALPGNASGKNPVNFRATRSFFDTVPAQLCGRGGRGNLTDCATGSLPVYRLQFSLNDRQNCSTGRTPTLAVSVAGRIVYEQPIPLPTDCRLAYYDWSAAIRIPASSIRGSSNSTQIRFLINRQGRNTEHVPGNNITTLSTRVVR
ncbi:hypothetical protein [Coralliovum pocilloporae]|uniref:hypothetical protein n=1 Tax=Coralliovum pocilloporae TaxID=3066369 RepID=UPI0033073FE8